MTMNSRLNVLCLTFMALLLPACVADGGQAPKPPAQEHASAAPKRILFVGNSYLYYNDSVHNHVRRMAEEAGPFGPGDYQYKSATIGGARLSHHNLDSLLEPGRLGIEESFDLVILQGGSSEALTEEGRQVFAQQAAKLNRKIRDSNAAVALYMTHAYAKPHKRFDPLMIRKVESTYTQTAEAIGALVIPVGLAFERAYKLKPQIELHKTFDGSHPSLLGTYLAACVVYASVYGLPVANVTYDYFGAIGEDDAQFLKRVADETVRSFAQPR